MINLNVNVNKVKKIAISSLNVLNDHFIANFKSGAHFKLNAFKTIMIFNEVFFEIEMKLNKLLIFFSTIIYVF